MSAATQNTVLEGRQHRGDLTLQTDVLIVGSGAGGAVMASELSAAGREVVVLEEGPLVPASRHARMRPSQSLRHLWRDGGMSFAVPRGDTPLINVTMGRCVGGSSMLTGGVCFRTPEPVLHEWATELGLEGLAPDHMSPYFEAVEQVIGARQVPADMRSVGTRLFGDGLRRAGHEPLALMRNTRGCRGAGQCNFGCPNEAKLSVDLSVLPAAMRDGARIISDCRVERLRRDGARITGVSGRLLDDRGAPAGRVEIQAKEVIVCAGAWHSPLLLKRSGLGRGLPHVGRHLTLHPAFRMLARFKRPVRGWEGALQSTFSDAFMAQGITLVSLFVPVGVLAATMPGFGPRHARRVADIPHLAMFGGLIHDEGGGVVRRGLGAEPWVFYRMSRRDRALIPRVIRLMAETFFAAGAEECFIPIIGHEPVTADTLKTLDLEHMPSRRIECASQHPLGSCRMGCEAARSVVDPLGRVWGLKGLRIADGSVLPTSLGVNPQVSVMAMALRIARHMVD